MKRNANRRKNRLDEYAVVYVEAEKYPEIERFVYTQRRTIYINLSARPDAKIVKLVQ